VKCDQLWDCIEKVWIKGGGRNFEQELPTKCVEGGMWFDKVGEHLHSQKEARDESGGVMNVREGGGGLKSTSYKETQQGRPSQKNLHKREELPILH